jgi:hypothetical protein
VVVPNTQTATTSSGGVFLEERLPICPGVRYGLEMSA